jgi:hypothetical protein
VFRFDALVRAKACPLPYQMFSFADGPVDPATGVGMLTRIVLLGQPSGALFEAAAGYAWRVCFPLLLSQGEVR